MKKTILALGIFLEVVFLFFYVIKYLAFQWGVQNTALNDSRIFLLTFTTLGLALITQIVAGIIVNKYKIKYRYILLFSIIFNLSLLFVWNFASNDLYTHIQRGRMMTKYGASPYARTYDEFKHDEFYNVTRTIWSGQLSIYGPVFTLFGAFISFIAQDSLLAHIVIYKLIYSFLNVLTGYFIYKITKNVYASLLYSWNPLVIFEIQLNNHFEVLTVFPMVLSLYFILSKVNWKKYIFSLSILTIGSLTKFFNFIIYPFYILYALKRLKTLREKFLFLFVGGFIQIVILLICYLPFMDNLGIDNFLLLVNGTFISPSITMLVLIKFFEVVNIKTQIAQIISQWIFKIYFVFLLVKVTFLNKFAETNVFIKTLLLVFSAFTLIYMNLITPWYTLSLITLVALYYGVSRDKKYIAFTYLLTIYSFFLYIRVI